MKIRMKSKYYSVKSLSYGTYDPTAEVIPGMQGWEERLELNRLYGHVSGELFTSAKKKFFKDADAGKFGKGSISPVFVTLRLKHGNITVMNGRKMQKYFEVGPSSCMSTAIES